MLQSIRDKAQGWIAWVIVVLISIPFALWGIQEYLGVGGETVIAKVNDREITEREVESAAFRFRSELRERLGAQYNPAMFEEPVLRKQVLESMIRDTLIQQAASDLGLRAGDFMVRQTIGSIPAFQVAGQFNAEAYKTAVKRQGMSEQAYEENLRATLMTRQLELALQQSTFVTDSTLQDMLKLAGQQRTLSYITLSFDNLDTTAADISEADQRQFYDQHKADFMTPERVKLEYVLLNIDSIRNTLAVADSELQNYFEQHKNEFVVPDKKRVSHILFEIPENATDEQLQQIREQADSVHQQLLDGAAFAELAQEKSQDIGSAQAGGDLGFIDAEIYDQAFVEAVSGLAENEVSEPVRTRFGLHIIKVTELVKGDNDDFDAVKDQVEKQYLAAEAEQIFFDYAERLGNLAYETPDSLEPVASDLKLELKKSDWITADGGDGVLASPKVTSAAFSEEVLMQGYNSEPLELATNELLVLRVSEHEEARLKAFGEVQQTIVERMKTEQQFTRLQQQASKLLQRLQNGETLEQLASELNLQLSQAKAVKRDDFALPAAIRDAAFQATLPSEGKASFTSAELENETIALVQVSEVSDGKLPESDEQRQSIRTTLANNLALDEFELYVNYLRSQASIEYLAEQK
ncbi:MAG: SurA N-terminal domain-containing protein [Chromatiales bacterium]|jgi:peptidyl-prolyl cis-trans isomerase D